MKYLLIEQLEDTYVNLFESGIFIRWIEYSALIVSEIAWYKLYLNIDKKDNFVYLEVGFPLNKKQDVINSLVSLGYSVRFFSKIGIAETYPWNKVDFKNKENLKLEKEKLIRY
jgi:hypothetical protein